MPTGNTDNMGKLFPEVSGQVVTLFAFPACLRQSGRAPAFKKNLKWLLNPDTHLRSASVGKARICKQLKSLYP